jgi:hypothetical protein
MPLFCWMPKSARVHAQNNIDLPHNSVAKYCQERCGTVFVTNSMRKEFDDGKAYHLSGRFSKRHPARVAENVLDCNDVYNVWRQIMYFLAEEKSRLFLAVPTEEIGFLKKPKRGSVLARP